MEKDVFIYIDKCFKCKRPVNVDSKMAVGWHKFIYRHNIYLKIKKMEMTVFNSPDGGVNYELCGGEVEK